MMPSPKQIQDEDYWKDAWEHALKFQSYKEHRMLAFTIGNEEGNEELRGQWLVQETIAGNADQIFVRASKDGVDKTMWIARTRFVEVDPPAQAEEETPE
jgi:hypothetical protein